MAQQSGEQIITVKDTIANPAPLGLMCFGMTTVLLNIHNAGFLPLSAMIIAMGLFFGGATQMIAGVQEFKKNNTFGATAFTSYGAFWIVLVGIWTLPAMGLAAKPTAIDMGWFLVMWGIFTAFMFIGTLKQTRANQTIFGSLTILFFLLAAADFTGSTTIKHIAGWEGMFCGFSAIYTAMAQVLNEVYGRKVLPL
ncbi:hypothetical protein DC094_01965 [Pelagibaculum spongiae]|uniref:Acetate uptake transporter n=1 Tax=Pelagibaculum spongiae TaxID=2080658 RepID=A0A2V1H219_9GAMM|nr:hypothetical protein DC094_01965 [Pelagibaculum spongiae]